jgi:acetyl esterase/lipase
MRWLINLHADNFGIDSGTSKRRVLPFWARVHPYLLYLHDQDLIALGDDVTIRRVYYPANDYATNHDKGKDGLSQCQSIRVSVDLWSKTGEESIADRLCRSGDGGDDPLAEQQQLKGDSSSVADGPKPITVAAVRNVSTGTKKPVVIFIPGGGWKTSHSRRHVQICELHRLVLDGWIVVVCNYGGGEVWPRQVDDCYNALRFIIAKLAIPTGATEEEGSSGDEKEERREEKEGEARAIKPEIRDVDQKLRVVISGASAGGHIASLVYLRYLQDHDLRRKCNVVANLLFYPALDPVGDTRSTVEFPFDLPFLHIRRGQSLMAWMFERAVLRGDQSKWLSASPLRILQSNPELVREYAPTLIVHGELDSVVPLEHSEELLALLGKYSAADHRHGRKRAPPPSHAATSMLTNICVNVDEEDDEAEMNLTCQHHHATGGGQYLDPVSDHGGELAVRGRAQDKLIIVPGVKHSFEAAGGQVTEIVSDQVSRWMCHFLE